MHAVVKHWSTSENICFSCSFDNWLESTHYFFTWASSFLTRPSFRCLRTVSTPPSALNGACRLWSCKMIASWSTADFFTEGSTDEELKISYTFLIPSIYKNKKELSNKYFESQLNITFILAIFVQVIRI